MTAKEIRLTTVQVAHDSIALLASDLRRAGTKGPLKHPPPDVVEHAEALERALRAWRQALTGYGDA